MSSKNIVEVVIKAKDEASKKLGGLNTTMGKLGIAAGIAAAAVVAGGVIIGKTIFNLAKESARVEILRGTFDNLANSIGENADVMITDLRVASRGMLNDADLMQASNKLVAMGLADTSVESSKLVEMSTQLGSAMGMTATDAAEAFALMLANQSIPRLDNFGISSGVVRDRIEELMKADANLTREQAFMNAVMEEGEKTMQKVGEQGTGAAAGMARLQAKVDNLKIEVGTRFLPILEVLADKLLVLWDDPKIQKAIDSLFLWIEGVADKIVEIVEYLATGDVEAAFDVAFGQGAYSSVMKVADAFNALLENWNKFYSGFSRTNNAVTDWINTAQTKIFNVMDAINVPHGTQTPWKRMSVPANTTGSFAGSGWADGGSFIVPGSGSGDRPYSVPLTPGEVVSVSPKGNLSGINLSLHFHSVVSLSDMANAKRMLLPMIEDGLRQVMAR